jgi:hypothetical protein
MAEQRSRFEQIYRQKTKEGEGTFSALGEAARERAKERADLRRLFPNTGMLGAMLESAFGKAYKAGAKDAKKDSKPASERGASAFEDKSLNVIRMNTAIMAKNSMVLPGMARDMNVMRQNITRLTKHTTGSAATKADAHFLKAKEREAAYETQIAGKTPAEKREERAKPAAGGIFKSLFGGIGSILGGTLALGGSVISSLVSGLGSVLGAVGGVASGILGVVGSAVSGLGIMGIIALAGAGYLISKMNKSGAFDDFSLGKMFGLEPRTDGKGLFEDTANRLDKFFATDKFTETLNQIKGSFAGLAAASLKVFSNLSDMVSNFLNLALQEIKIIFAEYSEKTLALAGAYYGGKAGLSVAGTLATLLGPGKFVKGAGLLLGGAGLGAGLGAFGGKSLAENLNEALAAGDMTGRQKDIIKEMTKTNLTKSYLDDYIKLRRLQEAGYGDEPVTVQFARKIGPQKYKNVQEALDDLQTHAQHNVKKETGFDAPDFKTLEKRFGVAFGAPMTTDETYSMLAMKFKRRHLELMTQNQRGITEGIDKVFNETKDLYTGPTKVNGVSVMPTKANQSDMANLIRKRFIEAGFTPEQAQAAVVNAYAESSLNPSEQNKTAKEDSIGLFQMNRKGGLGQGYTEEQLKDPNFNIDLAIQQAKKSQAFSKAGTVSEAIAAFVRDVERPANMEQKVSERIAMANQPLTDAIAENTETNKKLIALKEEEKEMQFSEILGALLEAMAASTTGTTVNNINNTSVSGGEVASPYNEDMLQIFKNRATQ